MTNLASKEDAFLDTPDITADRLEALRDLIPEAFSEGKVDFDKLRAALGDVVDGRPERYSFTWAGKRDAIRLLQTPSAATLVPAPEESVNWDTTQHLFIEGDNLEVLKLLYKAYFGRVKLIYIDPPYNTGNDFVYPDDFTDPLGRYLEITGQKDTAGNLLTSNPETSGRYHSAWLNMMYPRLFMARHLLSEDGFIFISVDDTEVANLKIALDEIFGGENFLAQFVWKSRQFPDSRAVTQVSTDHEYILAYRKRMNLALRGVERDESKFANPDNDPRGPWMSRSILGLATAEQRPNLHYSITDPSTSNTFHPPAETGWRYSKDRMQELIRQGDILFPPTPQGRPREKKFRADLQNEYVPIPTIISDVFTATGTAEIREIFGAQVFEFPKPSELLRRFVEQTTKEDDIVMDFFAGACPMAQAVYAQNLRDSGNRRFICVQLPERIDPKSDTGRLGFKTIAEVGKERIRHTSAMMKLAELERLDFRSKKQGPDLGFRVFKLAPSALRAWRGTAAPTPDEYVNQLALLSEPLRDGWRAEDVVWEVAIKEGFPLTSRVTTAAAAGQLVYRVEDPDSGRAFHICLDDTVTSDVAAALGLGAGDLLVVRDAAVDDTTAANLALQCRLKTL